MQVSILGSVKKRSLQLEIFPPAVPLKFSGHFRPKEILGTRAGGQGGPGFGKRHDHLLDAPFDVEELACAVGRVGCSLKIQAVAREL
jgi:hypothetical protein